MRGQHYITGSAIMIIKNDHDHQTAELTTTTAPLSQLLGKQLDRTSALNTFTFSSLSQTNKDNYSNAVNEPYTNCSFGIV